MLYEEYRHCILRRSALERLNIVQEEYRSLCNHITDLFTDLDLLENSDRVKDDLRRINLEIVVALVTVATLPSTFIIGAASMNFSDQEDGSDRAVQAFNLLPWYHSPTAYKYTFAFCGAFVVAAYSYFNYLGLVDFSKNTWKRLSRVLKNHCKFGLLKSNGKRILSKDYTNAIRRADGTVVAEVNGDGKRAVNMRISERTLRRIRKTISKKSEVVSSNELKYGDVEKAENTIDTEGKNY